MWVTSNLSIPLRIGNSIPVLVGRAAKFVNHPDNLPDIDPIPSYDKSPDNSDASTKYNLRKNIKGPTKLDL